jgi:hypothetical protein
VLNFARNSHLAKPLVITRFNYDNDFENRTDIIYKGCGGITDAGLTICIKQLYE